MLILSRKQGTTIKAIAKDGTVVEFIVCKVQGNTVKVGIVAPEEVKVKRGELKEEEAA